MGTLGIIGDRVCILCANLGAALAHAQNGPPVSSRIPQHRCMRERQHSHGVRTTRVRVSMAVSGAATHCKFGKSAVSLRERCFLAADQGAVAHTPFAIDHDIADRAISCRINNVRNRIVHR